MQIELMLPDGTPTTLHYRRWQTTGGRPVFCVHGLTRNGMDFEVLAETLAARGFDVIAPDMPGRGESPPLATSSLYNNAVYATLCLQLLARLGLPRVDWVGTSMGGMIAMIVANQTPGVLRSLVLNDVGCVVSAASLARIGQYVPDNPWRAEREGAQESLRQRTAPFGVPPQHWPRFCEHSIEESPQGYRLAYDPAIALAFAGMNTSKDIELWALWKAVKIIPTLLIRGEHSDLLLEETAAKMQATHPRLARYNVPAAGHAPALMSEAEINAVLGFLCQPQPAPGIAASPHHFSRYIQWPGLKKLWSQARRHWS